MYRNPAGLKKCIRGWADLAVWGGAWGISLFLDWQAQVSYLLTFLEGMKILYPATSILVSFDVIEKFLVYTVYTISAVAVVFHALQYFLRHLCWCYLPTSRLR